VNGISPPTGKTDVTPGYCWFWPGIAESAIAHLKRCFRDPDGNLLDFISYTPSPPQSLDSNRRG